MAMWMKLLHEAQEERTAGRKQGRPRRLPDLALAPPPVSASDAEDAQHADPVPWGLREVMGVLPGRNDELVAGALIGRDSEMVMLTRLMRNVAEGRGGSLLIEGEPGIGKSALVRTALTEATNAGCQVFWGAGDELGQAWPLLPFLEGLRVHEPSANPRRRTILRLLRGEETAARGTDVSAALAEQLLALIAEQCAVQPTVLAIDDLQWADQASIMLWGRLAKSVRQVPLLMIGMMRPVPQRENLLALRRAVGDAARLQLTRLNEAAVAELVTILSTANRTTSCCGSPRTRPVTRSTSLSGSRHWSAAPGSAPLKVEGRRSHRVLHRTP